MSGDSMLDKARKIHKLSEFKKFMRGERGLTDEDFSAPIDSISQDVISSNSENALKIFHEVFEKQADRWTATRRLPVHNMWHHFIVPAAILTAVRNQGGPIDDEDITEAIDRGRQFPGGSCGFMGTCGGAYSVGIVGSIISGVTPVHGGDRSRLMRTVSETLARISEIETRCCKRSSYIAMQEACRYLQDFDSLLPEEIVCHYWKENHLCAGAECPFHPQACNQKDDE